MILAFSLWVKVCFWAALFVGLKSGVIETSEISTITVLGFAAVWALVAGFVGIIAPIKANMNRSWVAYVIIMVLIALVAGLLH